MATLTDPDLALDDPWAVSPTSTSRRRSLGGARVVLSVWALGSFGAVARVAPNGANGWRGALAIAAASLLMASVLCSRGSQGLRFVGVVGAASVGYLVSQPLIGRLPIVVALAGVAVSAAAIVRWLPWRGHPQRSTEQVSLAVPLVVLAGAWWWRTGQVVPLAAFLLAALAVVEASWRFPRAASAAASAFARRVQIAASAVGGAILLVLLVPVLYVPGLVVALVARSTRRRSRNRSSWRVMTVGLDLHRRDARYPFATVAPGEARRHLVTGLAFVALLAGAVAFLGVETASQDPGPATRAPDNSGPPDDAPVIFGREFAVAYSQLPAYRGQAWADRLQAEEAGVPSVETFRGTFINLRDGRRVTAKPPRCRCHEADVWITGGSAVWGIGQRDDHTIASNLANLGSARGLRLRVDNMGERGTVFREQIRRVEQRLEREPPPDLIVFYNGFNETGVAISDEILRGGDPREIALVDGSQQDLAVVKRLEDLDAVNAQVDRYLASGIGETVARTMAEQHRKEQRRMAAIADRYGVEVRVLFQADAFASRRQLAPFEVVSGIPTDLMAMTPMGVALESAARQLAPGVMDLRPVAADDPDQSFLGLVHHNEHFAGLIAAAMLPSIEDGLGRSRR